jgi:hypothetical protein
MTVHIGKNMLWACSHTGNDNSFLDTFISDQSTYHRSGMVNRHKCRIWGLDNPRVVHEYECFNSSNYLDMLQLLAVTRWCLSTLEPNSVRISRQNVSRMMDWVEQINFIASLLP